MRALPDGDASRMAVLIFSETAFAKRAASGADSFWRFAEKARRLTGAANSFAKLEPQAKLEAAIKTYGLAFKGKALTAASATALKGLQPFALDDARGSAFALAEGVSDAQAKGHFVFIVDSLRMARLTGEIPKGEKLSASRVVGRGRGAPAMTHAFFRKKELVECIFHAAFLIDEAMHRDMAIFETPFNIAQKFATSGANGLAASHRMSESGGPDGMGALFSLKVAEHRGGVDPKAKAMIDVAWPVWAGAFDDEVAELTLQEIHGGSAGFLWHTYLNETSQQVGANYRAFVAARAGGPTPAAPNLDQHLGMLGVSELGGEQKEEFHKLQGQLKQLRGKTVKFATLPVVGAASGAEFAAAQMQRARRGGEARLSEPMLSDEAKFKRVLEIFAATKGGKVDALILFDGRGRTDGPRAAARASSYTINNKEMAHFSLPLKGSRKVAHRSVFSSRGETSSAAAACTGISARRFSELPRMCHDAKASALGAASCAAHDSKHVRLQGGADEKGHSFSHNEVKPISFWQTIMEHREVTRVVEFTPGSGASAAAASVAVECEGIAGNAARGDWLNSIVDRRAMHRAGHEDGRAEQLGGDADIVEKAGKFFGGATMEARRSLMPAAEGGDDAGGGRG
ncbi:unnamed protein product [Prorocentrum cordatum]|uniref:Uncharacterized protein n=1 Tax=Prorocentrum cordatum TaxID=2364126 RepID=A0ABN9WL23_9DINO|nr:unnamed protein product [Polarella glacialis]